MSETAHAVVAVDISNDAPSVTIESDSWFQVKDPKKRKRVQDRLAQRARRKRIAESRQALPSHNRSTRKLDVIQGSTTPETATCSDTTSTSGQSTQLSSAGSGRGSQSSTGFDGRLLTNRISGVLAALFENGIILGLRCGIQIPILSPPCTGKTPLSLQPTHIQMTVLHIPWIDRFPFPGMRNNAISLSCEGFDDEDFFRDVFTQESFDIRPGFQTWDPAAWVMIDSFRQKWGYLFARLAVG